MVELLEYIFFWTLIMYAVFIIVYWVKEICEDEKRERKELYKYKKKYYKTKQQKELSHKAFVKDFFSFLSSCIKFLFWGCIVLIIVGAYLIAIFKWFNTSHIYFWTGFKELIWALMPILNIFYILK